jgi:hypothetical protein
MIRVKEDAMGGVYSMHGGEEEGVHGSGGKARRKKTTWKPQI